MTDKERRAAKYLPFDSLKGLKEKIAKENSLNTLHEFPMLSEDEKEEMNLLLFDSYSRNQVITISYYENGKFKIYSGVIEKIDVVNRQVILLPKKKFDINYISKISAK